MTQTALQSLVFAQAGAPESMPLYLAPDSLDAVAAERTTARVKAGSTVSLASYFNAFPAAYWQKWTNVKAVQLSVRTTGTGTITVWRSDASGHASIVESRAISRTSESNFDLAITDFDDGGWYWFDITAKTAVTLASAAWSTGAGVLQPGKLSLGITTMDKPDYCLATLQSLANSPELLTELDVIVVVDQGGRRVQDEPGFAEVSAALGDQLQVILQANLGGSGGFSRSMAETLKRKDSAFVMLLDDDVEIEPESILRAVRFARQCGSPTIVGGHMLDLNDRPVLHAFSEIVDQGPFMWGPPDREHERHDFGASGLRETPWLHRREDSDFNGWWMCLIPTSIIREIGLALPVFIKWDDSEYGLRAGEAGHHTVSFPGSALWHISWVDKDDTLNWQAYFHARNRTIAALLHSTRPGGGSLLAESRKQDLKHLLSMQYYPVALRHEALRDVLAGPARLHETMPTSLARLRERARDFAEMHVYRGDDTPPATVEGRVHYPPTDGKGPRGRALLAFTAKAALRHWFTKPAPEFVAAPQRELAKRDATWWRLPDLDSALVDAADGSGSSWYTRDRGQFRSRWLESIRLHRQLARNWNVLRHEYRSALADITSPEAWEKTFGAER